MKLAVFPVLALGAAWALTAAKGATAGTSPEARTPVLVELFTSEGCSSCPPADELLANLAKSQPVAGALVIPLSEHVDYWNHLGWSDPYSSRLFSERQSAYAAAFRNSGVYTPQAVVDGGVELVGSDQSKMQSAIASAAREPKLHVVVTRAARFVAARAGRALAVGSEGPGSAGPARDRGERSPVPGEQGRELRPAPVPYGRRPEAGSRRSPAGRRLREGDRRKTRSLLEGREPERGRLRSGTPERQGSRGRSRRALSRRPIRPAPSPRVPAPQRAARPEGSARRPPGCAARGSRRARGSRARSR